MTVYFDNAATSPLDPAVFEAMSPYLTHFFGNPSSTHSFGREAKSIVETSRKKIAEFLQVKPGEIFFTSGGTEADNTALWGLVNAYNIQNIITSPIEHHAVLHTIEAIQESKGIRVHYLEVNNSGNFDMEQLKVLLSNNKSCLVSLMHANNEIGNITDLHAVSELCLGNGAFLHSDTVQTIARYPLDLSKTKLAAIAASAHKFHGPKGSGFMYINAKNKIAPYILGGGQERNMRAGTENVAGIAGLAKAMEIAHRDQIKIREHVSGLKTRMVAGLKSRFKGVMFNGASETNQEALYAVLNVSFPENPKNEMLLFQLDLNGIAASGGSACGSGALVGSHVLNAMKSDPARTAVRFSFSKFNTAEEVDFTLHKLQEILS